jgi:hypothetical protein
MLLGSKYCEGKGDEWQEMLIVDRPTPLISGEEGEKLRKRVWGEIVEALEKDIPRVKEV